MPSSSPALKLHLALPWLLLSLLGSTNSIAETEEYQTYIIHMDHSHKPNSFPTHESWHRSTLNSLSSSSSSRHEDNFIYSYQHAMHGFSARLTPSQLSQLQNSPAHRATYKESFGKLFTTHSTRFLGLKRSSGIWPASSYGDDVIIGIIDTGIWPESQSFNDKGMSPVPERWKGKCENGTAFSSRVCNRKIIGTRTFNRGIIASGGYISKEYDYDSPRDYFGHGSHTSSIAAGAHVAGANNFGYASGTARGVAPKARIAMYKVLWNTTTLETAATDVIAGMDQAIADGVDIMSLSLGFQPSPYFNNVIAIASLSAIEKGIFVVAAAGNNGTANSTFNGAPWIMTAGAGTIDRNYVATLNLKNGLAMEGSSLYPESVYLSKAPLFYGRRNLSVATCSALALDPKEVAGKIVICDNSSSVSVSDQMEEVRRAGGHAAIFSEDVGPETPAPYYRYPVPNVALQTNSWVSLKEYVNKAKKAKVESLRFVITRLGTKPAPQVAYFSCRGPDPINPGVLKPDILAPGFRILGAFVPNRVYVTSGDHDLVTDYALQSGTSMAAPQVGGVAALIRAVHRDWSPAAIRSAIMTTAYTIDNTGTTLKDQTTGLAATPLDFGAGHVNPNKAMDPGLVYDMGFEDYLEFLCGIGYSETQMSAVLRGKQWNCSRRAAVEDLNYPSFIAGFSTEGGAHAGKSFRRTVTNVGDGDTIYRAFLTVPAGMKIEVEPRILRFSGKYQKLSFVLRVEIEKDAATAMYGSLKWMDAHDHTVSSPIVAIYS